MIMSNLCICLANLYFYSFTTSLETLLTKVIHNNNACSNLNLKEKIMIMLS